MFTVSEKANEMMQEYFQEKKLAPSLRINLLQGGWSGPSLGLALDEPREDDQVFKEKGFTFAVNKELFEQVKPIHIDFVSTPQGSGYKISGNISSSCGSCSCS